MASRFPTPLALVQALHNREDAARRQFRDWLAPPIQRLVHDLAARHQLPHRLDRLTSHALHAAETYLRMRPAQDFARMSEPAFRAAVLLQVARQIVQPFGRNDAISCAPEPLPQTESYQSQTLYLPCETVGTFRFGGDWYGGRRDEAGRLWILVADVTGHGYAAYLLANALPAVWRRCWAEPRPNAESPSDVLGVLHDLLVDCLPEDVYVECTLVRLDPDGRVTAASAGGARLFVGEPTAGRLEMLRLRGIWLGFEAPAPFEQHDRVLAVGDELLLGTDGVFDQLLEYGGPGCDLVAMIRAEPGDSLLESVRRLLDRALANETQKDDITIVTVQRRPGPEANGER